MAENVKSVMTGRVKLRFKQSNPSVNAGNTVSAMTDIHVVEPSGPGTGNRPLDHGMPRRANVHHHISLALRQERISNASGKASRLMRDLNKAQYV